MANILRLSNCLVKEHKSGRNNHRVRTEQCILTTTMPKKYSRSKPATTSISKRRQSETMKSSKSTKRRRRQLLVSTAASLLSTSSAQGGIPQDHKCPPDVNGWAPSADCTAYYWCSGGMLASMPYDCVDGTLFDSVQLTCLPAEAVECEIRTTTTSTSAQEYIWTEMPTVSSSSPPAPSGDNMAQMSGSLHTPAPITPSPTATPTTGMPTTHPTPRQTFVGDAIYFADFPSRSCRTDNAPQWLTPEETFTTKRECCEKVMNWIPVEDCLGEDWVEPNYFFVPSKNPSLSPSVSPSSSPSRGPTVSPSLSPSLSPSRGPTESPTLLPTESPTMVSIDAALSLDGHAHGILFLFYLTHRTILISLSLYCYLIQSKCNHRSQLNLLTMHLPTSLPRHLQFHPRNSKVSPRLIVRQLICPPSIQHWIPKLSCPQNSIQHPRLKILTSLS